MRQTDVALKTMVSAQNKGFAPMTRLSQDAQVRTDAWSRAAQQVRERTSFLGLALDETALALQDVRDLQTTYTALLCRRPGAKGRTRHLQGEPGAVEGGLQHRYPRPTAPATRAGNPGRQRQRHDDGF
jgi:hypothetical protein